MKIRKSKYLSLNLFCALSVFSLIFLVCILIAGVQQHGFTELFASPAVPLIASQLWNTQILFRVGFCGIIGCLLCMIFLMVIQQIQLKNNQHN